MLFFRVVGVVPFVGVSGIFGSAFMLQNHISEGAYIFERG